MKKEINLACRDCKKTFAEPKALEKLNKHIAKSGHNDGRKIPKVRAIQGLGIFHYSVSIPRAD